MDTSEHLVDGKYSIKDLVDIDKLRRIFEKFTQATGLTIGFLDHPGLNILIASGWRDICTKFHRGCPASAEHCVKSNQRLIGKLKEQGQLVIESCENGLVDCATPIIIKGVHIATLATGQLLLKDPNREQFKRQAKLYGYDEESYLKALDEIPVISEKQLKNATSFLGELALIVSELGFANTEIKEKNLQLEEDLLERKRIEEFKDNVLNNVAHELRTPLHAMTQGIGILMEEFKEKVTGDQAEILKITRFNLTRLIRLVNNFLDFQRLEAGMASLNFKKVSLNKIVNEAGEMMQPLLAAKNLTLEFRLDSELPEALCDRDRIMQVVINLLDNAVKFTDGGAVTIASSRTGNKVVISVEDHGIGIRGEDTGKIFNKFTQLREGKIVAATGTGLGLAISKNVMDLHHGAIRVVSEYGRGSTFSFELPIDGG